MRDSRIALLRHVAVDALGWSIAVHRTLLHIPLEPIGVKCHPGIQLTPPQDSRSLRGDNAFELRKLKRSVHVLPDTERRTQDKTALVHHSSNHLIASLGDIRGKQFTLL